MKLLLRRRSRSTTGRVRDFPGLAAPGSFDRPDHLVQGVIDGRLDSSPPAAAYDLAAEGVDLGAATGADVARPIRSGCI